MAGCELVAADCLGAAAGVAAAVAVDGHHWKVAADGAEAAEWAGPQWQEVILDFLAPKNIRADRHRLSYPCCRRSCLAGDVAVVFGCTLVDAVMASCYCHGALEAAEPPNKCHRVQEAVEAALALAENNDRYCCGSRWTASFANCVR